VLAAAGAALFAGCASPDKANVELRRRNDALTTQVARLTQQHEADANRIAAIEARVTTVPVLPQTRLARLFTAHDLKLQDRLSGGTDLDAKRDGDEALRVYAVPLDETGDAIKATGKFTVEAFDLARAGDQRIGRWEFGPEDTKAVWFNLMKSWFVLTCPWQTPPEHAELTVKVSFEDELTGRTFTQQAVVKVKPPAVAATATATRPGGPATQRAEGSR